jgi:iron complex outermembrane recepter protein
MVPTRSTIRGRDGHPAEIGAHVLPDARVSANVAGFATLLARESVFDHVSGLNLELNGTRRLGGEAVVTLLPTHWLRLSADVTAVDARFRSSGRRVPFAPWLSAGGRALLTHPSGVRAGVRFAALAPRPLPHGARGEALYMLDASVGYRVGWFDAQLACENLLFRELREGEYHFASHWSARDGDTRSFVPTSQIVAGPPFNARLTLSATF